MTNTPPNALNDAIAAARAGRRDDAARMLREVVAAEPSNATAWTWLAGVTPDLDEQRTALEHALSIDPDNRRAQQGIAWLKDNHPDLFGPAETGGRALGERSTPAYEQAAVKPAPYDAATQPMPAVGNQPPQREAFVVPPSQTDRMPSYTPPGAAPTAVPAATAPTAVRDNRGNLSRWLLVLIWLLAFAAVVAAAVSSIMVPLVLSSAVKNALDPQLQPYNLQIAAQEIEANILWYTVGLIALAVIDFVVMLGLMFRARWAWIVNLLVSLLVVAGTVGLFTLVITTPTVQPRGLAGTIVTWLLLLTLGFFALVYLVLSLTSRRPFFRPKLRPRPQQVQAYGR